MDELTSLAFTIQASKGVYALLLGSGISSSAGILTGWGIVLDLTRQLAATLNEDCQDDPEKWYLEKYGKPPEYSDLLGTLFQMKGDRQKRLRSYFEPTSEEKEEDKKVPTKAHKAIAWLVSRGFIRVIITTNFDRLLERAMAEEQVEPVVLSSSSAFEGAAPLQHQPAVVLKIHGDYLDDTSMRNTEGELEKYDDPTQRLLQQVIDEYGLIVCGWSGESDSALRASLERSPNRRYSTFWTFRGEPTDTTKQLMANRSAAKIPITNADSFFVTLREKVESIEALGKKHPLTMAEAAETARRYLWSDPSGIRYCGLLADETERSCEDLRVAFGELNSRPIVLCDVEPIWETLLPKLEVLALVGSLGAYWGSEVHARELVRSVTRVAKCHEHGWYNWEVGSAVEMMPSVILQASLSVAALAAGKVDTAVAILLKPKCMRAGFGTLVTDSPWGEFASARGRGMFTKKQSFIELGKWLRDSIAEHLKRMLPDYADIARSFEQYEMVRSLIFADLLSSSNPLGQSGQGNALPGAYIESFWGLRTSREQLTVDSLVAKLDPTGEVVPALLRAGVFKGSKDNFDLAIASFLESVQRLPGI